MSNLQELRNQWEKNLTVIMELSENNADHKIDELIVILRDNNNKYYAYRYFPISIPEEGKLVQYFHVSADISNSTSEFVFNYIEKTFPLGLKASIA